MGQHHGSEFGVSPYLAAVDRTVACGDSGNDTLMLSGRNRAIVVGLRF